MDVGEQPSTPLQPKTTILRNVVNCGEYQAQYLQTLPPEEEDKEEIQFKQTSDTEDSTMPGAESVSSAFNIKPFSGLNFENPDSWLYRFQSLVKLNDWNVEQTMDVFRLSLTGPAEVWFDALPTSKPCSQ